MSLKQSIDIAEKSNEQRYEFLICLSNMIIVIIYYDVSNLLQRCDSYCLYVHLIKGLIPLYLATFF